MNIKDVIIDKMKIILTITHDLGGNSRREKSQAEVENSLYQK